MVAAVVVVGMLATCSVPQPWLAGAESTTTPAAADPITADPVPDVTTTGEPAAEPVPAATPSPTPAPTATPLPTPVPAPNKRGVHLLIDDGRNAWPVEAWSEHLAYARQAVGQGGYVTQVVRSEDLDLARWQHFMDLCAEYELTPILRLATTFDLEMGWWEAPQRDEDGSYRTVAAAYAAFVSGLDWPTGEHYVVVGNEPNHGNEWGGRADPAAYARFLVDVATAVRAADPAARVLNAGFDPYTPHTGGFPFIDGMVYMDAETFIDEMVEAVPDVFSYLDYWCSHVYPLGPFSAPPWEQAYGRDLINGAVNPRHQPPPPGVYNRGINGYEWELWKLSTYGITGLQVMITEAGWRHAETTDPDAMDGGAGLPDAETVAAYLDLAMWGNGGRYPDWPETGWTPWDADPRVVAVTPFAFDGLPREWGHTNWLMLDAEGTILGTYAPFDVWATGGVRP
jgi:hypothetical protein